LRARTSTRTAGQLGEEGAEQSLPPGGDPREVIQVAADDGGDVEQRSQRARSRERVADPGKDPRCTTHVVAETPDQGRFTDARLSAQEDEAARPAGGLSQQIAELVEVGRPLQQFHRGAFPSAETGPYVPGSAVGRIVAPNLLIW
jgi:hypothetical protein